jgi:two-component system cell cycle response regulator DivK
MAGESILIVEDVPESLKFTAGVLRGEGYRVTIASTAEQALSTLRFLQPQLILVDFMLPGMDGLELTARIRQDPRLHNSRVVAITGSSLLDESKARKAGCDGFLSKPVDAHALISHVRGYLGYGEKAPGAHATPPPVRLPETTAGKGSIPGLPEHELAELQESFLRGGKGVSRQLLASVDGQFDAAKATRTVHQWIGSAGLLGYPAIAQHAQNVENLLRAVPCAPAKLRGSLTNLARAFHNPTGGPSNGGSAAVARALSGKRVALIGLDGEAADLMCGALGPVGAKARLFEASQSPRAEAVEICHLVMVHVRPDSMSSPWLAADTVRLPPLPTIFFGSAEDLLSLNSQVQRRASGLLMDGCLPEEALLRLRFALTQTPSPVRRIAGPESELVIAYDDAAAQKLIEAKMNEYGLRCRLTTSGPETILLLRHLQPPAAVVDLNLDGFEALAAIRAEAMPVRTILITSGGTEDEILRGFTLGAEDYLVQPFSPIELVARLKRLAG